MAAGCNLPNYTGRQVAWEFSFACGDVDPASLSYLPLGSMNNKTFNISTQDSDNTTDDTNGVTSSIVTYLSVESTASGFATTSDGTLVNQGLYQQYFIDEVIAQRQPSLWLRLTTPSKTYYVFANITSFNITAASTDTVSFETSITSTSTGSAQAPVVIVDTP